MKSQSRLIFTASFAWILYLGTAFSAAEDPGKVPPSHMAQATLDPSKPVSRDQFLEVFRQMLALPLEDRAHGNEAVAARRIPPDVQVLDSYIKERAQKLDWEKLGPPHTVTLPNGKEVPGIPLEVLGPNLGANITQEDLDTLMVAVAETQERLTRYNDEQARARFEEEHPSTPVNIQPDDFMISAVRPAKSEEGETVIMVLRREDLSQELHVEKAPILDGRHINRVRKGISGPGRPDLVLEFTEEGSRLLAKATREARGSQLALIVQGELLSAPMVQREITGESVSITGLTAEKVDELIEAWGWRAKLSPTVGEGQD